VLNLHGLSPAGKPTSPDGFPDSSLDGTKDYLCQFQPDRGLFYICTMHAADGSNRSCFLGDRKHLFAASHYNPANGSKIVLESTLLNGSSSAGPQWGVFTAKSDGSSLTACYNIRGVAADPQWWRDGSMIAVNVAPAINGNGNGWKINYPGCNRPVHLTSFFEPIEASDPGPSPDGTHVAFEWNDWGNGQSSRTCAIGVLDYEQRRPAPAEHRSGLQ